MNNTIEYKGYVGTVEFSQEDGIFFGKVMGLRALLSYEGSTAAELLDDFHGVVDDYLALCRAEGKEPERAFKGNFNVRISPELHKKLVVRAASRQMTLNSYVEQALANYVAER